MDDEAKRTAVHWRRILFGFHLLVWLIARLAVGSIGVMPPPVIYNLLDLWALFVAIHGLLLVILDGRDQADLPIPQLHRLIEPRERRWSLLGLNAALWIILTMAIASRVIPEYLIGRYAVPLSLAWLGLTAVGMAHVLLVVYAEVRQRTGRKRKNDDWQAEHKNTLLLAADGELLETIDEPKQSVKRD